jgi:hypothetical protein
LLLLLVLRLCLCHAMQLVLLLVVAEQANGHRTDWLHRIQKRMRIQLLVQGAGQVVQLVPVHAQGMKKGKRGEEAKGVVHAAAAAAAAAANSHSLPRCHPVLRARGWEKEGEG